MAKTTKDCIEFLVQCAENFHPIMADTHETAEEYEKMDKSDRLRSSHCLLTTPSCWKRMKKFSPKNYWEKIGFGSDNNAWPYYNPPIVEEDIQSIRWFSNGPSVNDDDYDGDESENEDYMPCGGLYGHIERHIYEVYEMKDGTLRLGDNFGD